MNAIIALLVGLNFNTSNVTIQRNLFMCINTAYGNFNTSNVTIQLIVSLYHKMINVYFNTSNVTIQRSNPQNIH